MADALDFDPTFEMDPEDYAGWLDELSNKMAKRGNYEDAEMLTGAAKWLRKLDEERGEGMGEAGDYWRGNRDYRERQRAKMIDCEGCYRLTSKNHYCVNCEAWNGPDDEPSPTTRNGGAES